MHFSCLRDCSLVRGILNSKCILWHCSGISSVASTRIGYNAADSGAKGDLGLGCGTPVELAELQLGEDVLDLGCGAGFDAGLTKKKVGSGGLVVGVDMTPEMLIQVSLAWLQIKTHVHHSCTCVTC